MSEFLLSDVDSLTEGSSKLYEFEGSKYLVYRLSDGLFATSAKCTHLFKSLAKGIIVSDKRTPVKNPKISIGLLAL